MTSLPDFSLVIAIGAGATAVMDLWLAGLARLGIASLNFDFVGRWVGHLFRGRFRHAAIGRSPPIRGERLLGWLTHYLVGIVFATGLVLTQGLAWVHDPHLGPALAAGVLTVLAPLGLMQPAMGLGLAASRTATPLRNCLRSLANHTVFGLGLYLAALAVQPLAG